MRDNAGLIILAVVLIAAMLVVGPLFTYWSLYELTHAESFSFKTWLSGLWFLMVVGGSAKAASN